MSEKPLLSIHVSVFNLENYIKQCLDSILTQSFTDYELLVIDNGSTDKSIDICEAYAAKYKQIKYVKLPLPTVIGRPYVYAMKHFEGKYFMSVDGDDYLREGALQRIADTIKKSHADLIMGSFICDIEDNMVNFRDADFKAARINGVPYKRALAYLTTLPNFHTFQWRFIVNGHLIKQIVSNNKKISVKKDTVYSRYNDGITVTGYLVMAKSIAYFQEPFYVYRRRGHSLSSPDIRGKHGIEFFKAYVAIAKNFEWAIKKFYSYKRKYIFHMLEARFELFRSLFLDVEESEYKEICDIIQKNRKILSKLKPVSEHYRQFYRYIKRNKDVRNALFLYRKAQETVLMNQIEECKGKKVYVFPTGMCGENICEILKGKGIEVAAFLDNDQMKREKFFSGTVCKLPSILEEEETIENCCVFLATAYRNNIEIMKKQLMDYGILEKNIIIR